LDQLEDARDLERHVLVLVVSTRLEAAPEAGRVNVVPKEPHPNGCQSRSR
jgi:hypothetical protein